jgi:hypothetical protein
MAVQFVISNPPRGTRSGKARRSTVAKSRRRKSRKFRAKGRRVVGRRGRAVLGLSLPVVETGLATAGGLFIVNAVTAKVQESLAGSEWAQKWSGRAAIKLLVAIVLKLIAGKVNARWANAMLGGGLASIALTVAKQFSPSSYDTRWGLAGVEDNGGEDLSGYYTTYDAINAGISADGGLNGIYDSAPWYRGIGVG